jgi:hypothetical protein
MEPPEMEPPAKRLQRYFKEQFVKFGKTPFVIPFAIAVSAAVYYLVFLYGSNLVCLSGLVTPLTLLGICWYFGIKSVKRLLVIGVLASLVFGGVLGAAYTNDYQHIDYKIGASNDKNLTLTGGTLQPIYQSEGAVYEYRVTLHLHDNATPVKDVVVLIEKVGFPTTTAESFNMTEQSRQVLNSTTGKAIVNYTYNTTLSNPVNAYWFSANVSGDIIVAADFISTPVGPLIGPTSKNTNAILGIMVPISLVNAFTGMFPIYSLIVVLIWWTRRARKMRKDQMEKWELERTKEDAKKPKEDAKVSLQRKAMGLEDEGTFVCSECGADVPAEATKCPKCGEKFE